MPAWLAGACLLAGVVQGRSQLPSSDGRRSRPIPRRSGSGIPRRREDLRRTSAGGRSSTTSSSRTCIRTALQNNYSLRGAAERVVEARERLRISSVGPLPDDRRHGERPQRPPEPERQRPSRRIATPSGRPRASGLAMRVGARLLGTDPARERGGLRGAPRDRGSRAARSTSRSSRASRPRTSRCASWISSSRSRRGPSARAKTRSGS